MNTHALTLTAEDTEDLQILSARLQDAVATIGDFAFLKKKRRFVALFNRYCWEDSSKRRGKRVRSRLWFDGVLSAKARNIRSDAPNGVVSLLALQFTPESEAENPGGAVEMIFSGGGSIRLVVECLDACLSDVSDDWTARGRPSHESES